MIAQLLMRCSSSFWQAMVLVSTCSTIYEEETLAHGSVLPTIAKLSQILLLQDAEKPDPLCFVV